IRWLKTDLAPLSRDEADLLETRAIELGARGADWVDGELWGDLDEVRKAAVLPLRQFIAAVRACVKSARQEGAKGEGEKDSTSGAQAPEAAPAQAFARALYDLLERVGVPERLEAWAEEAEREGRRTEASDHRLVWEGFCGLIDEIAGVMGD